jgi:hypothetical protein
MDVWATEVDAGAGGSAFENPSVGATSHLDSVECSRNAKHVFERTIHRATARAPGSDERAVDVKKNDWHSAPSDFAHSRSDVAEQAAQLACGTLDRLD